MVRPKIHFGGFLRMAENKRDIFFKIENFDEFNKILEDIELKKNLLKKNFEIYDNLNQEENKIFVNRDSYLEDMEKKLISLTN